MARLHLKYRRDDLDPVLVELTERFMATKPWRKGDEFLGRTFDTWLHGAAMRYNLPYPSLTVEPWVRKSNPHAVGEYRSNDAGGEVYLVRWSMISLFHQFRHHQQHYSDLVYPSPQEEAQDAQAWACSLFYVVAPRRFRRAVRAGQVAGVYPEDLLRRKQRAS